MQLYQTNGYYKIFCSLPWIRQSCSMCGCKAKWMFFSFLLSVEQSCGNAHVQVKRTTSALKFPDSWMNSKVSFCFGRLHKNNFCFNVSISYLDSYMSWIWDVSMNFKIKLCWHHVDNTKVLPNHNYNLPSFVGEIRSEHSGLVRWLVGQYTQLLSGKRVDMNFRVESFYLPLPSCRFPHMQI